MFKIAIDKLKSEQCLVSEPIAFQVYLRQNRLQPIKTANYISIQTFKDLHAELKLSKTMALRLGSRDGDKYTYFSLIKVAESWDEFFFFDNAIFSTIPIEPYQPRSLPNSLLAFRLLPKLSETTLVNLSIASGLLPHALGLDEPLFATIPATCQSTFDFEFRPHHLSETILKHQAGQVEIDAIFAGKRNGEDVLFVIEAKSGERLDSLNKTKLFYPLMALKKLLPRSHRIVPIYLRVNRERGTLVFNIAECGFSTEQVDKESLTSFTVKKKSRFSLLDF